MKDIMYKDELWKRIDGYDYYYISNYARVYNNYYDRYLKPGKCNLKRRYMRVVLSRNGKSRYFLIHRLVAEAFCDKSAGMNIIHHIDNDPSNNKYNNLMWCSQSYNVKMAYKDGLIGDRCGKNNPNYKGK